MRQRTLGRTGLNVSELALGGLALGRDFDKGRDIVRCAVERGVTYIDTAAMYKKSEESLGQALTEIDRPVVISSKIGQRGSDPFNPQDKAGLRACVEESLRLLKREFIDLLMIHEPDRPGQWDWFTDWDHVNGPVVELLDELKKEGLIKFSGLGGTTAYELANLMDSGRFDVVLTAFNYSLLFREAENAILPTAKKHNMGVIIGSPLQQGSLARRRDEEVRNGFRWMSPARRSQFLALYAFLDEVNLSLPEMGLRFAISNPIVSTALMGAQSVEEVEQNVAAIEKGPLPDDILNRLNEIAAMVPFRPTEEPFSLPMGKPYRGPGRANR